MTDSDRDYSQTRLAAWSSKPTQPRQSDVISAVLVDNIAETVAAAVPASYDRSRIAGVLSHVAGAGERTTVVTVFPPLSRHIRTSLHHIATVAESDHRCVIVDWSPHHTAVA